MKSSSRSRSLDHGYAWVVLAACSCLRMLIDGTWASLGVIFVKWKMSFDVSPAQASVVGSMVALIIYGVAPVSSALAYRLTSRVVVVGAGILTVVCFLAASFVTQFWHLYIIMPFLSVGMGLAYQPGYTYYIHFFDKHFAVAHMINAASTGMGILAIPPLMEFLTKSNSWRGVFQIMSAIMAHICACGLLLRHADKLSLTKKLPGTVIAKLEERTRSEKCIVFLKDVSKDFDLSLFRNVRFIFHAIINSILQGGQMSAVIYLVPYAISVDVSPMKSSFLMLGYGSAVLVMRLSPFGLLVDKHIISASSLGGIANILGGIVVMIIPVFSRFEYLMVTAVLFGTMQGLGGVMLFVVVARSPGSRDKGPAADAWFLLSQGVGVTVFIYLVGFITDSTGTYTFGMVLCGLCFALIGFILLMDPCLIRWQNRRERNRKDNNVVDTTYDHLENRR